MKQFSITTFSILLFLIFSVSFGYANDSSTAKDDASEPKNKTDISHTLGFKVSNISFSGLAYTQRIIEDTYIQVGGFFTYDSDQSTTDYRFQLGLEFQRTLANLGEFSLMYILGGSFDQQRNDNNLSNPRQDWLQAGTGISVRNVSSSGLTVHFDGGVLRYRTVSGSKNRNTFGIGGGIFVGYSW